MANGGFGVAKIKVKVSARARTDLAADLGLESGQHLT